MPEPSLNAQGSRKQKIYIHTHTHTHTSIAFNRWKISQDHTQDVKGLQLTDLSTKVTKTKRNGINQQR